MLEQPIAPHRGREFFEALDSVRHFDRARFRRVGHVAKRGVFLHTPLGYVGIPDPLHGQALHREVETYLGVRSVCGFRFLAVLQNRQGVGACGVIALCADIFELKIQL